ncbi:MAG: hypothetical protein EP330_08325 [Deltaproteobacteria bacterium]|nr:MAG: hypothetical protein EP330_08325 [Deltaproteobacteria bacterium]
MLTLLLTAALAHDPLPEDYATPPAEPASAHTAWLWQGFQHDWTRKALGLFSVPHRVSRFESRIVDAVHTEDASTATFAFAQSTGVDGDWMTARGFAARVQSPDVHMARGSVRFAAVDLVDPGDTPKALARFQEVLVLPVPEEADPELWTSVVLLQGLRFTSRCEDGESACNSDGIWPYRFQVVLAQCTLREDEALCPITVEVGRAWTPHHGGVRGIETKPINQRMGLDVEVGWVALSGPYSSLLAHPILFENALASTSQIVAAPQQLPIRGLPQGFPNAAVGLHALGFEFFPTRKGEERRHRGRYVGGWGARVGAVAYDPDDGALELGHAGGIFLPKTVAGTGVSVEIGMTVLQFAHPDAHVDRGIEVSADLCANSAGAPWFSDWQRCEVVSTGERTEAAVPFAAP